MAGDEQEKQGKDEEKAESEERQSPSGRTVYHAVLSEGEDELKRSSSALFWSGLAAGLSMGFSLIAEGVLKTYLPSEAWTPLVSKFGYSLGFLIVILGRQQLFTENTLTPILPLLKYKDGETLLQVLRLWVTVLIANMLGALAVAWVLARSPAFDAPVRQTFIEIGRESLGHPFWTVFLRGIFAGWLIALIVWLLPFAETARVWVIILLTYVVGVAKLSHVVAGAIDAFVVAASGVVGWGKVVGGFLVPALLGNIVGGVLLVAVVNHAQVVAGEEGGADA
jgi:formate/nitrite transporter FocA (FNT family)